MLQPQLSSIACRRICTLVLTCRPCRNRKVSTPALEAMMQLLGYQKTWWSPDGRSKARPLLSPSRRGRTETRTATSGQFPVPRHWRPYGLYRTRHENRAHRHAHCRTGLARLEGFPRPLNGTLSHFGLAGEDREAVVGFFEGTKGDIVEGMAEGLY